MDSAHHSLGWQTRVECMSSEGVGEIWDAFFQYTNWPVKHWWRNRRRRTWGPRATQWRWNPLPLFLQVSQSKLGFFSLCVYLRLRLACLSILVAVRLSISPPRAVCTSQRVRNRQRGRLKFAQFSHAIAISAKNWRKFLKWKIPHCSPLSPNTLLYHSARSSHP
jgi:hypothetical protein